MTSRASGKSAYVTAHRMAVKDAELPFELAFLLTTLVLEHHGGPLKLRGNEKKPWLELVKTGYVQLDGESIFDDEAHIKVVWRRSQEILADPEARVPKMSVSPPNVVGTLRDAWWALATPEGVDRVGAAWVRYTADKGLGE